MPEVLKTSLAGTDVTRVIALFSLPLLSPVCPLIFMIRFSDMLLPRHKFSQAQQQCRPRRSGFTLVEMLAVIGIIAVLGVAIGVALSGSGSSTAALGNAQRMVSSMFQAARTNAVMKGQETAVIIYRDGGADREKALRFIGIVYRESDGAPWKPLNRGTYLPKGLYFVPPTSYFDNAQSSSNTPQTAAIQFPITAGTPDNWYLYTFNKHGNLSGDSVYLLFAPSTTVVRGETLDLDRGAPLNQMGGIAVRKTGGALMIDSLNDNVYNTLRSDINAVK